MEAVSLFETLTRMKHRKHVRVETQNDMPPFKVISFNIYACFTDKRKGTKWLAVTLPDSTKIQERTELYKGC
jgi:hypothetical protein